MNANVQCMNKLSAVFDLIRLPKQYGTLLVLWPTLWSLFMASGGRPPARLLAIFVIGTFLMRSAGCAINDVADRGFDPHVERTKSRPLANGSLTVKEALSVFAALSLLAFALVLQLNRLAIALSFIGIMLAAAYPFVKRVSHWPQAVLGMAFGWGAVMAWAAAKGTLGIVPALIFVANIFWSLSYDTVYALMDIEDDLKIGVKSTAILFGAGVYKALTLFYVAMGALLVVAGYLTGLGPAYYTGLFIALALFLHQLSLVRKAPSRQTAFRAFLANALGGGIVLAAIIIDISIR